MTDINMKETNTLKTRYVWIDNLKLSCCILVVLGHFYMSMVESEILPNNIVYNLCVQSVYTFHVPLFFVCSGFLYQKSNKVHCIKSWSANVLDKLLNLGVPYITFTVITLVIKNIFADSVNNPAGDYFTTIFVHPVAPYWYLYALFLMFFFIPCVKNKKQAGALFAFAFVVRIIYIICLNNSVELPFIIYSTICRMIWFVIGMCIALDFIDLKSKISRIIMVVCGSVAIALSIYFYRTLYLKEIPKYIIGLLFVISIIILANNVEFSFINKMGKRFSEYFMPVYVMHTIVCAGVRILLLKLGVDNPVIHIILGLSAGFLVPIAAYEIAKRIPVLLFFIYPKKAILKMKRKKQ
ncbi:MAG: acyltransferase family protein [Eubacterium sp.]